MSVMSPQQVILSALHIDGSPALPQALDVPGAGRVPVWNDAQRSEAGGATLFEFRHFGTGRLVVFQLVAITAWSTPEEGEAPVSLRGAFVAWAPAEDRRGKNPIYAFLAPITRGMGLKKAGWDVEQDADGAFVIPALDADGGAHALEVKAAWPEGWRKRLPGDAPGDPLADPPVPPAPPTGARCLGLVIA